MTYQHGSRLFIITLIIGISLIVKLHASGAPKPPTDVKVTPISSTAVTLSWSPDTSKSILAYLVYYLPVNGGSELQKVVKDTVIIIDGLTPYTNYTFYLVAYNVDGASPPSAHFYGMTSEDDGKNVSAQDDDGLQFLVMADWGGLPMVPYKTPIEAAVSNQMAKFADTFPIDFILTLGDNFYFDGVANIEDARFKETYEDVYTADSLQVPWYLVAGNHDYNGNISAQIGYSKISKRWNYPDYYYSITKEIPGTNMIVEFILLDTILLCGNSGNDLEYRQPQGPEKPFHAAQHWHWLQEKIQNSRAAYLIVGGHYPVYSVAEHGPTKILINNLDPLLHKYNVTAYFSGHDHNLQHLQYTDSVYRSTVDYFISGSGNFIDPSMRHKDDVPRGSSKFHWADVWALGGFGYVQATSQKMTFTFVEANGNPLYQHTLYPRKLK